MTTVQSAGSPTHSNGIRTVSRFTYTQQWQLYTSVFSSLHTFCHRDLDLDPITWIYDLDLDLLKMSLCVKNEHYRSMHSKYRASAGMLFCSRYLDSEPVPLRYNIDLDIHKLYCTPKNEFTRSRLSKVRPLQTARHTNMCD